MISKRESLCALVIMVLGGLSALFVSSGWTTNNLGYENISLNQFMRMMQNKNFVLVNVHIPYEGEIEKTDLLIPFNTIEKHLNQLPQDKKAKIVVYCMTGPMGEVAAEKLVSLGFTRVSNFQGGMRAWENAGKQLVFRRR